MTIADSMVVFLSIRTFGKSMSTKMTGGTFVMVGPLMVPFVWMNPRFSRIDKILWTLVILCASYAMFSFANEVLQKVLLLEIIRCKICLCESCA